MKTITVQISDNDFADLVRHLAKGNPGRALVAVHKLVEIDGDADFNIDEEVADQAARE